MSYNYPDASNRNSLADGEQFQDFVMDILSHEHGIIVQNYGSRRYQLCVGENVQGWEIKLDRRASDTKRLSIEIAEKTMIKRDWVPSGIYRQDNGWLYIQGNYDHLWVFMKNVLVLLHQGIISLPELKIVEDEISTVRKFYLPFSFADQVGKRISIPRHLHPSQRLKDKR